MNRLRFVVAAIALSTLILLAGCKAGYRIEDGSTGKTYLTKSYKQSPDGQVEFTDSVTHQKVTVLNAGIQELDQKQYDDSVRMAKQNPSGNQ
jgi:hypothetical protein